jgi:Zn-dependent M16 (insulinase) family peptidase
MVPKTVSATPIRHGITIPARVSYAAMGAISAEANEAIGLLRVVRSILSYEYLWNEIRVKGGAYGTGFIVRKTGEIGFYSYRDPSPARSLEVYRNMGAFVKEFAASGADITGFIISSIADTEPLLAPAQQGRMADGEWFEAYSYADAMAERQQLLNATAAELAKWVPALEALRQQGPVCVVRYADALESCKEENLTILDI